AARRHLLQEILIRLVQLPHPLMEIWTNWHPARARQARLWAASLAMQTAQLVDLTNLRKHHRAFRAEDKGQAMQSICCSRVCKCYQAQLDQLLVALPALLVALAVLLPPLRQWRELLVARR